MTIFDPGERVFWGYLTGSLILAFVVFCISRPPEFRWSLRAFSRFLFPRQIWLHPSARTDYTLMFAKAAVRTVLTVPWAISAYGVAVWTVGRLDLALGIPDNTEFSPVEITAIYSFVLFIAWDFSRYLLHRWLHRIPWLWEFHKVHHSAEVLTPFTLYRTHPVESFLFTLRGLVVTGFVTGIFFHLFRQQAVEVQLLGVNAVGFVFNLLGGNLRHSHIWLSYGKHLEYVLISPAQHQIHHSICSEHFDKNFGTWLSIWDWVGGSLLHSGYRRKLKFGLTSNESNHNARSATSAIVQPVLMVARRAVELFGRSDRRTTAMIVICSLLTVPKGADGAVTAAANGITAPESATKTSIDRADVFFLPDSAASATGTAFPKAHDLTIDTISIVGRPEAIPRIAGAAHFVGETELDRFENSDIHRVLQQVPGVYVRGEDGYGLRPNIGLRGANPDRSSKITLMEDGVLMAPAPYAAPAAYYFPIPNRLVGVEVFKGPASIAYGPNTIGGALNMQTRSIPLISEGNIDIAYGLNRTSRLHSYWGTTKKGWGLLLEGTHLQSSGFKDLDGGGNTGFSKNDLMAKIGYHTDAAGNIFHQIELKIGFADERSRETYLGLTAADFAATPTRRYAASQNGLMEWSRFQGVLRYFFAKGEIADLQVTAYRHDFQRDWNKLNAFQGGPPLKELLNDPDSGQNAVFVSVLRGDEDSATQAETLRVGNNGRTYVSQGLSLLGHWRPRLGRLNQEIEVGIRLHRDQIDRNHTEAGFLMRSGVLVPDGGPIQTTTKNRGKALALALHIIDELEIAEFLFTPGVRIEMIERDFHDKLANRESKDLDTVVLPGVSMYYQAVEPLGVFVGVHKGFSPVSPGQSDQVEPEQSINYEAGARLLWQQTSGELIGYFNNYNNLTGECTFSTGCPEDLLNRQFNGGEVFVYGMEALLSQAVNLAGGWSMRGDLSYTMTLSQFRSDFASASPQFGSVRSGDKLPYVPEHQGGLTVLVARRPWELSVSATYVGAMRDVPGQGVIPDNERIDSHLVVDLATQISVRDRARLYGTVKNLLNEEYAVARRPFGLRPGQPIFAEVGAKIDF